MDIILQYTILIVAVTVVGRYSLMIYNRLRNKIGMKMRITNRSHFHYNRTVYIVSKPGHDVYGVSFRPRGNPDLFLYSGDFVV